MFMKKLAIYFVILSLILIPGCSKKVSEPDITEKTPAKKVTEVKEPEIEPDEFYVMMQGDERPVAVMIDNDTAASRPQMGLESAYMIYEIIVEGGSSRMMALFKKHDLDKVGPVRSSRHYFLDYALEHDAIYCHAGWSPKAQTDIRSLGVNNINGILGDDGNIYWRDYTYDRTWHNLYTGVDKLFKKAENDKNYRTTTDVKHTGYLKVDTDLEDGEDIVKISLPYSNNYKVTYEYDSENKVYKRFVNGGAHMSQTKEQLTAKNIIIYQIYNFNLADNDNVGRQDLKNIGSGIGYYVTNGKMIEINWEKDSREGKTIYTTADGEELLLNPGNTYVQIIPQASTITLS